jgi:hypothetical protein
VASHPGRRLSLNLVVVTVFGLFPAMAEIVALNAVMAGGEVSRVETWTVALAVAFGTWSLAVIWMWPWLRFRGRSARGIAMAAGGELGRARPGRGIPPSERRRSTGHAWRAHRAKGRRATRCESATCRVRRSAPSPPRRPAAGGAISKAEYLTDYDMAERALQVLIDLEDGKKIDRQGQIVSDTVAKVP